MAVNLLKHASTVWGFRSESFGQLNLLKLLPWYSTRKRNLKNSFKKKTVGKKWWKTWETGKTGNLQWEPGFFNYIISYLFFISMGNWKKKTLERIWHTYKYNGTSTYPCWPLDWKQSLYEDIKNPQNKGNLASGLFIRRNKAVHLQKVNARTLKYHMDVRGQMFWPTLEFGACLNKNNLGNPFRHHGTKLCNTDSVLLILCTVFHAPACNV